MNTQRRQIPAALASLVAAVTVGRASATSAPADTATEERVVYHVNDVASAREALVNIANQLTATPRTRIALVANGRGIFMLVAGEKDRVGEYQTAIAELAAKGVKFDACRNSMTQKGIDPSSLAPGVQIVPAGVAELTRLQVVEHYAYLKP